MRVMIRQVFDIPQYGWNVTVYYAVTGYDVGRIMQELERLGCGGDDLKRAYRNLTSGERNTGITYSNTERNSRIHWTTRKDTCAGTYPRLLALTHTARMRNILPGMWGKGCLRWPRCSFATRAGRS